MRRAFAANFAPLLATVAGLAGLFASSRAHADVRDAAAADALFREGRKQMVAHNYVAACAKFQESYRLDPAAGTLLNLGDCEEKSGHLAVAWTFFREAERGLGRDDRATIAKQRADDLQKRLAFTTLKLPTGAPEGTRVFRDDVELKTASLDISLPVDPGHHVLRVASPGRAEARMSVDLAAGETREIVLPLEGETVAPAAPRAATSPGPEKRADAGTTESRDGAISPLTWVAFGVGGVGLVVTAIGTWQVLDAKSTVEEECDANDRCSPTGKDAADRGNTASVIATIAAPIGVLGIAAGIYLLVSRPKGHALAPAAHEAGVPLGGGANFTGRGVTVRF